MSWLPTIRNFPGSLDRKTKMGNLIKFLSESKAAADLHSELYNRKYQPVNLPGSSSGPSWSSSCNGKHDDEEIACGCWVHHMLEMLNEM